jgi:cation:H+ antiporter
MMVGMVSVLLFILAIIAFKRQGEMKHGSGVVLILTFIFYSVLLAKSAA